MSTLAGLSAEKVELVMGRYGSWRADVTLTSGEPPTGAVQLVVGDLDFAGTVLDSGLDAPGQPRAVVVGAPGWEQRLAQPITYQSAAGVRLATIITDLSIRSSEPVEQPNDVRVGAYFAVAADEPRQPMRLVDVLGLLHRRRHVDLWRVDPDGVTRFGPRPGDVVTAAAVELERNAGIGMRRLGVESVAAFLPGGTYDGETIQRFEVLEHERKREVVIWQ
jgi:hypothetical protein